MYSEVSVQWVSVQFGECAVWLVLSTLDEITPHHTSRAPLGPLQFILYIHTTPYRIQYEPYTNPPPHAVESTIFRYTSQEIYRCECDKLGVLPLAVVDRGLTTESIEAAYLTMTFLDMRAMTVALAVSVLKLATRYSQTII